MSLPASLASRLELPVLGSGKTDYVTARRMAIDQLGLEAA